jgi:hypothetical protein
MAITTEDQIEEYQQKRRLLLNVMREYDRIAVYLRSIQEEEYRHDEMNGIFEVDFRYISSNTSRAMLESAVRDLDEYMVSLRGDLERLLEE